MGSFLSLQTCITGAEIQFLFTNINIAHDILTGCYVAIHVLVYSDNDDDGSLMTLNNT